MAPSDLRSVVRRKIPDTPTLGAIHKLTQPPPSHTEAHKQLIEAYIVPTILIGLLDCLSDDHEVDAQSHLDALGFRPVWKYTTSKTAVEGAARTIVARLRSQTNAVCLVLLFGKAPGGSSKPAAAAESAPATADAAEEAPASEEAATETAPAPAPAADRPAPFKPGRRPKSSGGASNRSVPSDDAFIPLSRPIVLRDRTGHGGGAGGDPPSSNGSESGASTRPLSAAPTRMTRTTFAGGPYDDEEDDGMAAAYAAAAIAAAKATAKLGAAPPLKSQHHLPTAGNWVRLSAKEHHEVRRQAETARRRAAESVGSYRASTFGDEERLSASRRWAHQGAVTTSGKAAVLAAEQAAGAALVAAEKANPGSFLPMKVSASALLSRESRNKQRQPFRPLQQPIGEDAEPEIG